MEEKAENYDVMHIFMLYPKGKYDAKDRSFQNLMNVLFRNQHSAEEKLEEMNHICMYYEQEGKKAGLVEGMLIGEQRGKVLAQTANVERLMKKQLSMQEAFNLLGIEEDMQEKIIKRITNDEKATNEIKR